MKNYDGNVQYNERIVEGKKVITMQRDFIDCCILEVEVGTNGFQGGDATNTPGCFGGGDLQTIASNQVPNDKLIGITGLQVGHKHFIGKQRLDILHLVCKDVCLVFIAKIVIDHAPHGSIS